MTEGDVLDSCTTKSFVVALQSGFETQNTRHCSNSKKRFISGEGKSQAWLLEILGGKSDVLP